MRTYPKLLRTNGKLAQKFGVGAPKFGVGAPKFRVGAHSLGCAEVCNRIFLLKIFKNNFVDISGTFQLRAMRPSAN